MIVYGDLHSQEPAGVLLERLRLRADRGALGGPDERRGLLIEAGKLEQAVADALPGDETLRRIEAMTELAAAAFLGFAAARSVRDALARIELAPDRLLRLKEPEGFAFYTLYPEHYARTAELWLKNHADAPSKKAVVVGVRSIGTSLSAVVAQVLSRAGWTVRRLTVRPTGHPYRRRVELPDKALNGARFGLVVDEGPGRSGSSMAATAQALANAGLESSRIAFMPGHGGDPAAPGSEEVRRWWANTRRYVAGPDEPIFDGRSLVNALAERSGGPVVRIEDLSAGAWRMAVYSDARAWPAAFPAFERTKLRVVGADGSSVLWKFEGLTGGAEAGASRMTELAERGWTVAPLASALGFVARPWLSGKPLRRESRDEATLVHLGRYIAAAALPPVPESGRAAALEVSSGRSPEDRLRLERLREMLYWNVRESLGERLAERARALKGPQSEYSGPGYGDGRLGPEEWLRRPDGKLVKVDCVGHRTDHTVIGAQPVAWDLAGAIVEWELEDQAARTLLEAFSAVGGEPPSASALEFYRLAYAAFRLGQCAMCTGMADPEETLRLERAARFYRAQLAGRLAQSP